MSQERRRRRGITLGKNGWTFSEQLDNVAYTVLSADTAITPNAILAPDGTVTAEKVACTGVVNTNHGFSRSSPAGALAGTQQCISLFAKQAEKSWIWIRVTDFAAVARTLWFNTATGLFGTVNGSFLVSSSLSANGFYRISAGSSTGAGAGPELVEIGFCDVDNVRAFAGAAGQGVYMWGLQFDLNVRTPSPYRKTDAVAFP